MVLSVRWQGPVLIMMSAVLSGCGYIRTATFPEEAGSPGGTVVAEAIYGVAESPSENKPNHGAAIDDGSVARYCQGINTADITVKAFPITWTPLIMAGFNIFYDGAVDEMSSYIKGRQSAFSKSYSARLNLESLEILQAPEDRAAIKCLRLTRTPKDASEKAAEIILALETIGSSGAMVVRPLYTKIDTFAASTRQSETPSVAIGISLGISYLDAQGTVQTHQRNISIPKYVRGSTMTYDRGPEDGPYYVGRKWDTAIMPYPKSQPVTIALVVSEVGTGLRDFENMQKAFARNAATLKGALGSTLQSIITE